MLPYADLRLYYGLCPSHGFSERQTYEEAPGAEIADVVRHIDGMLLRDYGEMGDPSFVHDEVHAQEVIRTLRSDFPEIYCVVLPKRCMHGNVGFNRKLRIPHLTKAEEPRLITALARHQQEWLGLERRFLLLDRIYSDLSGAVERYLEKELMYFE